MTATTAAELEPLLSPYGGTTLTGLDVFKIGEALLDSVSTTVLLGHASPAGTLDYTQYADLLWADVPRDFAAWASGRSDRSPDCAQRLTALITDSGWLRFNMQRSAQTVLPSYPLTGRACPRARPVGPPVTGG